VADDVVLPIHQGLAASALEAGCAALLGTALHQFLRGNYTGPAVPLLLSGINLLRQPSDPRQDPDT